MSWWFLNRFLKLLTYPGEVQGVCHLRSNLKPLKIKNMQMIVGAGIRTVWRIWEADEPNWLARFPGISPPGRWLEPAFFRHPPGTLINTALEEGIALESAWMQGRLGMLGKKLLTLRGCPLEMISQLSTDHSQSWRTEITTTGVKQVVWQ
jgi:hypothetical protein